jgi:hypothetical protein
MSDRKIYEDAAAAFRYMAQRLVNQAAKLDAEAARKRTSAQEQLRLAQEMDEKAALYSAAGPAKPEQNQGKD